MSQGITFGHSGDVTKFGAFGLAGSPSLLLIQVLSYPVLCSKALQSLHTVFPPGNNNSHAFDRT